MTSQSSITSASGNLSVDSLLYGYAKEKNPCLLTQLSPKEKCRELEKLDQRPTAMPNDLRERMDITALLRGFSETNQRLLESQKQLGEANTRLTRQNILLKSRFDFIEERFKLLEANTAECCKLFELMCFGELKKLNDGNDAEQKQAESDALLQGAEAEVQNSTVRPTLQLQSVSERESFGCPMTAQQSSLSQTNAKSKSLTCTVFCVSGDGFENIGEHIAQVTHDHGQHCLSLRSADNEYKYSIGSGDMAFLHDIDPNARYVTVNNNTDVFMLKFTLEEDAQYFMEDANNRA